MIDLQQVYKIHELTINVSAQTRTNQITNTTFFTMDVETGKKIINFTLDGESLDLTSATVLLGFNFVNAGATKIIDSKDGSVVIESAKEGRCNVILPNHLYEYGGRVYIHTYIMFDDGRSLDAGVIVTEFKESWLDSELEEMSDFYVKRFEDLVEEIRRRAEQINAEMDKELKDVRQNLANAQTDIDRVQNKIDALDVVNQNDFDAHVNNTSNPHGVTIEQIGAAATSHNHAADDITSGTLSHQRIPFGVEENQVAAGNHTHPAQTTITGNAGTATRLQTPRQINGTNFDGSSNITTANWGASRDITIGNTTRSVNGSENADWSLVDLGAAPTSHTHPTIQVQEENPDLDNYTEEGTYFFKRGVVGAILNPPPNSVSGWLNVTKGSISHDGDALVSQRWQRATEIAENAAETWTRFYDQLEGRWSQWLPVTMFPWATGFTSGVHQSDRTVMQFGTVILAGGANVIRTQVVNFDTRVPFETTPNIQLSYTAGDPRNAVISSNDQTATGFRINVVAGLTYDISVRWFAVGVTTPTMI